LRTGASTWLLPAWALLRKDALSESRSRAALNASLLFALTALVAVAFGLGPVRAPLEVQAALLWVLLFFAAMAGLSRAFVAEEESGTALALRLSGRAEPVLLGKLLANLALMVIFALIVLPLFVLLLGFEVARPWGFAAVLGLGVLGLSAGATVAAALVAKARARGELFAALAFPILVPGLISAIIGTQACLPGSAREFAPALQLLVAYDGLLLTLSFLVFHVLWEE
jgi:heme exporter protein B